MESWDADFSDAWKTADLVDCMLSFAATHLMSKLRTRKAGGGSSETAAEMLQALKASPKALRQFLILAHLYANTDTASLQWLRAALVPSPFTVTQAFVGASVGISLITGAPAAMKSSPFFPFLLGSATQETLAPLSECPVTSPVPYVFA